MRKAGVGGGAGGGVEETQRDKEKLERRKQEYIKT